MDEQELKEQIKQEIKDEIKKSKRKKRTIILIVFLVIAVVGSIAVFYYYENNISSISQEEFSKYKTEITITPENWKDYVIAENRTEENKDDFGEVKSIEKNTYLKLKDDICGYVILEFKIPNITDEETYILIGGTEGYSVTSYSESTTSIDSVTKIPTYDSTFNIDELEDVKVNGYIYTIDLPDDVWKTDKNGNEYFRLEMDKNYSNRYYKEEHTNSDRSNYIERLSYDEYDKYKEKTNE